MNLKTFFEHFDTLAEAPNGIQRLRELILDMAVRGKLVPQNPEDEPAIKFLNKALDARKTWYQSACNEATKKASRKPKKPCLSLNKVLHTEQPFAIPGSWIFCLIEDLSAAKEYAIKAGPFGSALKKTDYTEKGYKIYGQEQVIKGDAEWGDYFINEKKFEELKSCAVEPGDLLISLVGTIGKTLTLPENCQSGIINPRLLKFSLHPDLNRKFIEIYLCSPSAKSFFLESSHGGTMNILNLKIVSTLPIPLPPLAEQKRIVAKVDELMALCDALEAAQQTRNTLRQKLRASALDGLMNAPNNTDLETAWAFVRDNWGLMCDRPEDIEGLRQVVLQMAVKGKLVPQDSEDEPATLLLKEIELEIRQKASRKKQKKGQNSIDTPFLLPQGWVFVKLEDISTEIHYGLTASANHRDARIKFLRITDIQNNSVDWTLVPGCDVDLKKAQKYRLRNNDIVIARTGGTVGKSYLVESLSDTDFAVFASYLIRVSPSEKINHSYLKLTMGTSLYWEQLADNTSGTGQPNVNATSLKSFILPLPPFAEQKRIVAKVDELMKLCDHLEASLRRQQETAQALAASALCLLGSVR